MAVNYFQNFPNIFHTGNPAKNILIRVKFLEEVTKNNYALLNYQLQSGDRPDTVAYDYYGDSAYAWVVYMSNNIIDPIYDWYLDDLEFEAFIVKKYGSVASAQSTVIYYYNNWSYDDSLISSAAYAALGTNQKKYWSPAIASNNSAYYERKKVDWHITPEAYSGVYTTNTALSTEKIYYNSSSQYDDEFIKNESKRNIRLLAKSNIQIIEKQLKELVNV